jgi:hypothetical protein
MAKSCRVSLPHAKDTEVGSLSQYGRNSEDASQVWSVLLPFLLESLILSCPATETIVLSDREDDEGLCILCQFFVKFQLIGGDLVPTNLRCSEKRYTGARKLI